MNMMMQYSIFIICVLGPYIGAINIVEAWQECCSASDFCCTTPTGSEMGYFINRGRQKYKCLLVAISKEISLLLMIVQLVGHMMVTSVRSYLRHGIGEKTETRPRF